MTRPPPVLVHPGGIGAATGVVRVVPFPRARRLMADYLAVARGKHLVHALVEVDVTVARRMIREHRAATGESLSFTAFVIACLGKAVGEDCSVRAYRQERRRLVIFGDVNVCVLVEHEFGGGRLATPYVIRSANRRSCLDVRIEVKPRVQATQVERKIQSAFQRAASLDAGKIWVQTAGGVVTLRGTVRSWAEHQDAERAAWAVPGVTAVRNDLEIVVQELAEV